MRYMLLICADQTRYPKLSQTEQDKLMADYRAFQTDMQAAGVYLASDRLRPTMTATTVRVREGKVLHTDGPFAETKEQIGGFFLINVKNLDEALAWAAKVPSAKYGSIEVRPVWEYQGNEC